MEYSNSPLVYTVDDHVTDNTIASLLGLSTGVVISIFTITMIGISVAGINFREWLQGDIHMHGDPSILYLGIFLICATMLLVIQHHFEINKNQTNESL